jgi:hypothetical protein
MSNIRGDMFLRKLSALKLVSAVTDMQKQKSGVLPTMAALMIGSVGVKQAANARQVM